MSHADDEYDVSYLRRSGKVDNTFYFDMVIVALGGIELVLPISSILARKTKRQTYVYGFSENLLRKFFISY
jgi:hypothetical protein